MKVYWYDLDSCVYLGEDFCAPADFDGGGFTKTAPPAFKQGEVPVYDHVNDQWKLVPVHTLRQSVKDNE